MPACPSASALGSQAKEAACKGYDGIDVGVDTSRLISPFPDDLARAAAARMSHRPPSLKWSRLGSDEKQLPPKARPLKTEQRFKMSHVHLLYAHTRPIGHSFYTACHSVELAGRLMINRRNLCQDKVTSVTAGATPNLMEMMEPVRHYQVTLSTAEERLMSLTTTPTVSTATTSS